ncbi:hypothetical protein Ndes2526B_g03885 [Nannochloris sp. 'desiccata']|nr:hypothetical protein NADE_006811 [Chlorella desiccata (nom. nud.)]
MGQCFSSGKEDAQAGENSGAKLLKLASLNLQDAGSQIEVASGGKTALELTAAKALIDEAKSTLDQFDESNRISETDLQDLQRKVDQAKELVAKADGNHDV